MSPCVFALGCHPDDIEFMMAGTLILLKKAGCELHYMNLANGSCGTTKLSVEEIVEIRGREARKAASILEATFHESLVADIEVLYTQDLIRRVAAIIREVQPDIILLPSPEDYMEDHMNTSRIGVTAAFCRGMRNYRCIPEVSPIQKDVILYHALPYGLRDGLDREIRPAFTVDISSVIDKKEQMLSCHMSQKKWLDESQGIDAYITTMREMAAEVGRIFGGGRYAEGWRKHSHLGFSSVERDPLGDLLEKSIHRAG
jgi:LmbE family N-acetylglucosaminyl deacetylase